MNISGLKSLCNDIYTSIIIRTKYIDQIQIDVKNKNHDYSYREQKFIYDEIKDLSETEQINKIIEFYLDNNTIHYINDREHIDRYEGKFFAIEGTRNIGIQVPKTKLDKNIIKVILTKYIKDRNNFLNSIENNNIIMFESNTTYYKELDQNIILSLKTNDKLELLKFENDFIINFIKNKLDSINEKIKVSYIYSNNNTLKIEEWAGYVISSNSFSIKLTENIYEKISDLVIEHNNKFNIEKSKVLKNEN